MMRLRNVGSLLVVCLSLTVAPLRPLQAGPYSAIYSFGDSLTDTGNVYLATGGTLPPAGYYNGRFSNGPLWIDHLAVQLGLAPLTPAIVPGGTNYAVGGATSGSGFTPLGSPNLLTQIGLFQSNLGGGPADSSALYTINAGGNDFLGGELNPATPAGNISLAIQALAALGARHVLVLDLELIGSTPRALASLSPIQQAGLNLLSQNFSNQLKANVAGLRSSLGIELSMADIFDTFQQVHANPGAFGFTNVSDGAYLVGDFAANGYLYWDDIHPSAAAHALMAQRALAAIPEPSALVMLGLGVFGLSWSLRGSRRSASRTTV
jgi:phospholipase/lecithinase/hemolysin